MWKMSAQKNKLTLDEMIQNKRVATAKLNKEKL